jgi:hypothetical protein
MGCGISIDVTIKVTQVTTQNIKKDKSSSSSLRLSQNNICKSPIRDTIIAPVRCLIEDSENSQNNINNDIIPRNDSSIIISSPILSLILSHILSPTLSHILSPIQEQDNAKQNISPDFFEKYSTYNFIQC